MTTSVEMHVVVVVPLELDDDGMIVEVGQPYTADENPFLVTSGETYVPEADYGMDWRRSTDQEIDAAYDTVSALLFKRPENTNPFQLASANANLERRPCQACGEPCVLEDLNDPESWIHAPEANDQADHTAEVA